MVAFNPLSDKLVLCKTPAKLAAMGRKKPFYFRRYSAPSATKAIVGVWADLASVAISNRGRSADELRGAVAGDMGGKDYGGAEAANVRRVARFAFADASLATLKKLAASKGAKTYVA